MAAPARPANLSFMQNVLPNPEDESMTRPPRGEVAEEEEEYRRKESHHKGQPRRELTSVREQVEIKQAELAALAAQEDELAVKVEGKASVYAQLEAGREARGRPKE